MHTIWTGERVRLRPFKDENEWCDLKAELHIEPNMHWGPLWTPLQQRKKRFEEAGLLDTGKMSSFAIERLDTGELVGVEDNGLEYLHGVVGWVGTFIKQEHWHNGFGIEAKQLAYCYLFENYPISQVWSDTVECHTRAANGIHRSGMKFVCRAKCFHNIDGELYDLVCYSIYREEWEQLPVRQYVVRG
jgi:RimJ/RimL family protein N-acetyltransferase